MTPPVCRRVVLDTNVVIGAGSRWIATEPPQPVNMLQRLIYCIAVQHVGLYCSDILGEYARVMVERQHPPERVAYYLTLFRKTFDCVEVRSTSCHTPPADPDDLIFILCALDGNADLLVSADRHLLGIREAYHPCPAILTPEEACVHLPVI